jgi:hypothetical protein
MKWLFVFVATMAIGSPIAWVFRTPWLANFFILFFICLVVQWVLRAWEARHEH